MSEVKPALHQPTVAAEVHDGPAGSRPIFPQPVYITVARGAQVLLAFVIMCMAGYLIHGLAMDPIVFALVCGLFTLIIVIYALVSEKVPSAHKLYNYWAILSLDLVLAIFWLAAMGANAANRAAFVNKVNASCYNDGSAVNSNHCVTWKRAAVAGPTGLAVMSAIAGLSALQCILFVGTTAFLGHQVRLHLQANKKPKTDAVTVEANAAQAQPMLGAQAPAHHPQYTAEQQYAGHQQYAGQQQTAYQQQVPYQQQHEQQQQHPGQSVSPQSGYAGYNYPQHTGTSELPQYPQTQPAAELYQQNPQQVYSPSATPAPHQQYQQPHHPPQ